MGVDASMSQMLALIDSSQYISIADVQDFYYAARALLVTRHEDLPVFDQAFSIFWRSGQSPEKSQSANQSKNKRARLPKRPVGEEEVRGMSPAVRVSPMEEMATSSRFPASACFTARLKFFVRRTLVR